MNNFDCLAHQEKKRRDLIFLPKVRRTKHMTGGIVGRSGSSALNKSKDEIDFVSSKNGGEAASGQETIPTPKN